MSTHYEDLPLNFDEMILDPGRTLIWSQALTALDEQLAHLADRIRYYGDTHTPEQLLEIIEGLRGRILNIQRTSETR